MDTVINNVKNFIEKIVETRQSGHASEHSYRPALKEFFEQTTGLKVINEPKRSEHGAPDFVFLKEKTVIAYAEAKDINVSLDDIEKGEQMVRYYGYSNIILTNGLDFRFYRNGIKYGEPVVIGKLHKDLIEHFEPQFRLLIDTIGGFIKESKEPIKSGVVLSKVMAGKARRIRDNVKKFLEDEKNPKNENLLGVYEVIKKLLLHGVHFVVTELIVRSKAGALADASQPERTSAPFGPNWSAQNTGNISRLIQKLADKAAERGGSVIKRKPPLLSFEEQEIPHDQRKVFIARRIREDFLAEKK